MYTFSSDRKIGGHETLRGYLSNTNNCVQYFSN